MDVKFITYAGYWIRYFMSDMIRRNKNRNIIEQSTDDLFYDRYLNKDEEESSENVAYNISKIPTFEIEDVHMAFDKDKNLLDKLMSVLNKREKEIIENYFGIGNKEKKNLEEIGTIFKISTERVRQIKDMSLIKMKSEAMLID
jgi:RNA polymerase sigma factor (sigma-70 family)